MMILSCGEVLWDLFPEGARFGGAPANFACHAALLGGEVSLLSAVGLDERGTEAFAILQRFGIDTSLIQRINETTTGTVDVTVDPSGKPSYTIQPSSAWDHIAWSCRSTMMPPVSRHHFRRTKCESSGIAMHVCAWSLWCSP